jgi:hypothetical protein
MRRMLRRGAVEQVTGLSRSGLYQAIARANSLGKSTLSSIERAGDRRLERQAGAAAVGKRGA